MTTSKNGSRWFSISCFLLGLVLAGFGGILRGDWIGRKAAAEAEERIESRMQERFGWLREDMREVKKDLKELLRLKE
jgi:hypothetical protein